ncbi:hypothetical protein IHQ68_09875 [Chelatococcus sambhunathii]|uniref:Uncharacterized protein n=1 Tax=Chelatococcus sambhunathii TaxID=363953 RepID=A0ABU1DFV5_9HYPH|nr:hypothetical protein [Chelatococcus sambhunathii]MDR4306925.1 hypothetical protein [Chelatococcus sambhunathii]
MTASRPILLLAAIAAIASLSAVAPAAAEGGVSVTIRKGPSYLNTRTTPTPGSYSRAAYQTNAATQSTTPTRGIGFTRWPLPSNFDLPGY